MVTKLVRKIFGSRNERVLKRMDKVVMKINDLEEQVAGLADDDFPKKTDEFRDRLQQGTSLEELIPEVFAVVREASKRMLNMRHFDVQLIGGMVLH